jgi:flagellar motility protein MotE (MotC chaperone)
MAEDRRNDREDRSPRRADAEEPAPAPQKESKGKKKRGKGSLLFFLFFIALGAGMGLHFSGLWDARPLLWGTVPKLPYVGETLSRLLRIPERYTLTAADRRAFELADWQKRLDEREKDLSRRESEVNAASGDLGARAESLERQRAAADASPRNAAGASDADKKLIEQVVRTYQDMSPRNAAQIVEQLSEPLAVELLQKLPSDARGSILGKMPPQKAARLTELMASGDGERGNNR